jgi:hypothetical protein
LQQSDNLQRGGLAYIPDIGLVGDAGDQNSSTFETHAGLLQGSSNALDHITGHPLIDLTCSLDETRTVIKGAQFPGKIVGVDGNAVPSNAWAGIKRSKAVRLRPRRINNLPDVHAKQVGHYGQFIHQTDVHGPESIFDKLYEFC